MLYQNHKGYCLELWTDIHPLNLNMTYSVYLLPEGFKELESLEAFLDSEYQKVIKANNKTIYDDDRAIIMLAESRYRINMLNKKIHQDFSSSDFNKTQIWGDDANHRNDRTEEICFEDAIKILEKASKQYNLSQYYKKIK